MKWNLSFEGTIDKDQDELSLIMNAFKALEKNVEANVLINRRLKSSMPILESEKKYLEELKEILTIEV